MTTRIIAGDCRDVLATLPEKSVQMCVTSPPYWGLRDYGHPDQLGQERTVQEYVANLVAVFRGVWRVLKDDGVLWVNLGDSYARTGGTDRKASATATVGNTKRTLDMMPERTQVAPVGIPEKNLIGVPWRVAFALQDDGWILRQDIVWSKPNPMPESVTDRCTKSHEYIFLLSKQPRYYYDAAAIAEPIAVSSIARLNEDIDNQAGSERAHKSGRGEKTMKAVGPRFGGHKYGDSDDPAHKTKSGNVYTGAEKRNKRSVWTVATQGYSGAHYATFPPKMIEPCIQAGSREGDTVLDPFGGSGTTGMVADRLGRHSILIDLNPANVELAKERVTNDAPLFADVALG